MDCSTPGSSVLYCFLEVCSVSYPLSLWCYLTISSSAVSFSFCFQSFPASESLLMSQLLASWGQIVGASASASVLPMNIQDWFPLGLMNLILLSKGLSRVFFQHHNSKASVLQHSAFFMIQLSHPYMTTRKTVSLTVRTYSHFVGKMMFLLLNMLSRFLVAFLPRSKCLLRSWLQSLSQWFWSRRKENLSLLPLFPLLFAVKWWDRCHDLKFF